MNRNKIVLVLLLAVGGASGLFAQPLTIGSVLPDHTLQKVLRYKVPSASLASFRGKPLLLCFWNTDCTVGLSFLPHLDSVQRGYGKRLQVLVVGHQSEAVLCKAFADKEQIRSVGLPLVVGDTVLKRFFPHRSEPHLVWIGSSGRVEAITGYEEVKGSNLLAFLEGRPLALPLKKETMDNEVYYSKKPLMEGGDAEGKKHMMYYSFLGGERKGVQGAGYMPNLDKESGMLSLKAINFSGVALYHMAYIGLAPFHRDRIVLEGFEGNTSLNSLYCYDLRMQDTARRKALQFMKQDLDRSFGTKSSYEKRKVKVLVLKRTSGVDKLRAVSGGTREVYEKEGVWVVRNAAWKGLVDIFFNTSSSLPHHVVDETGISGKVQLQLNMKEGLASVRRSFQQYDLDLVEEEREIDVIVLKKEG
jgi:hypothetical protein